MRTTKLKWTAAILAIIGGVTSTVSGGLIWVPYIVARRSWGVLFPLLGFVGFVLGILIIFGGIFIIRGRGFLGGNLAIWCGIASPFGYDGIALLQAIFLLFGQAGFAVGYILTLVISVGFPVLGGILALIYGGTKGETNQ